MKKSSWNENFCAFCNFCNRCCRWTSFRSKKWFFLFVFSSFKFIFVLTLVKPCAQPRVVGSCKGLFPRYFFNATSQSCEQFNYGGCDGNANNFVTYSECFKTCPGNPCKQERKVGPCRAAINRYFYNALTNACELFSWGGCDANGNNFLSSRVCKTACVV